MEEVKGSIPFSSTLSAADHRAAMFLGGVVAGEGYFSISRRRETFSDGSPRLRFRFGVEMATRDGAIIDSLQRLLRCGQVRRRQRDPRHLEIAVFTVDHVTHLRERVIPFAESYLFPSAKLQQFEHWRQSLVTYLRERPTQFGRGPSRCSADGCERPVRGRGLCRRHYYRATGY